MSDTPAPIPGHAGRLERLIVTRPAPEAAAWVDVLRGNGWPAQALPLIDIAPPDDERDLATLQHWRRHWMQADAILFVSGAAVTHFFADALAPVDAAMRTRFWAPGPGTARLLKKAIAPWGWGADRIDSPPLEAAQFDSEHLWPVVSSQVEQGRLVLIVRGTSGREPPVQGVPGVAGHGRDWLIQQCLAAGAQVQGCVAYARRSPPLSTLDQGLLAAACGPTPGSAEWCKEVAELGLLTPRTLSWTDHQGAAQELSGFLAIDEERLRALPPEVTQRWMSTGLMAVAWAHLLSLGHARTLAARQKLADTAAPAPAAQ